MKKPFLLLLVSTFLAGSAVGQALPVKKKKPAATTEKVGATADAAAAPADSGASTAPPLPKDFDPKIATDARATDGKPKPAVVAAPGDKKAKFLKPSNDAYEIGKAQLDKGEEKEAMVYFDKALKLYPNNFEALLLRGKAKVMRKLYPEAVVDLNKAAKGLPENPEVYFWRGRAKQEQDKDKEAVVDFDKALKLKEDMGEAYYWRGHSYSELDMLRENACPDFAKAAELGNELGAKAQKKYCTEKSSTPKTK